MHEPQPRHAGMRTDANDIANSRLKAGSADTPAKVAKPGHAAHAIRGLRLWIVIGGMMLAVFLVGLDLTMLSTIVPPLTDYFGTIADVAWYETAYVLAVCVFIPMARKIYSIMPNKHVYLIHLVIFEVGSIVCAVSTSSHVFIIGRAINGIGSAGLLSGALLIISAVCSPRIRPVVTSFAMSLISVGSITGPLIAGALTDAVTWRWVAQTTPREAFTGLQKKLDPVGIFIFAGLTAMLLQALAWGGSRFGWSSSTIIGLLCGAAGLTAPCLRSGSDGLVTMHLSRHLLSADGLSPSEAS
ncbi:hypothetical protein VTI74DRAFT_11334 [Chaetomium olivicolor]